MYIVTKQFSKLLPDVRSFDELASAEHYRDEMLERGIHNYVVLSEVDPYAYLLLKMECNNLEEALDFIRQAREDEEYCQTYR